MKEFMQHWAAMGQRKISEKYLISFLFMIPI